jgi:lysine-N-methylase
VIELCDGDRCPFLECNGLCRIISELGDDYMSIICREHPRFYHRIGDRIEGGLGLSCEEAARIVLSSDNYNSFTDHEHNLDVADETEFDSISHRNQMYAILRDEKMPFGEKIRQLEDQYFISHEIFNNEKWQEILSSLEYLNEEHKGILSIGEAREEYGRIYERFLAYLVFRHLSIADSYENLRARLCFCLLLCFLLCGSDGEGFEQICEHARIISEEIEYSEENTAELIFEFETII